MTDTGIVLRHVDDDLDEALARLSDWLRIPSISAIPAHRDDCRRAAGWLAAHLRTMGFSAELHETAGHPIVVAHAGKPGAPKAVFYGHYDVQPADPLGEWHSPPFEPRLRAAGPGRTAIFARGASDDKGQVMTFVEACAAWYRIDGELPLDITMIIEGEEEIGSPHLAAFLSEAVSPSSADFALVCDTDMADCETPAITVSLRGLVHEEMTLTCATMDLHSGVYGGAARNPLHALSRIIAALHDAEGKVTIPGFYDGIGPMHPRGTTPLDEQNFLTNVGLTVSAGEKGFSLQAQTTARPCLDVNGLWGGYCGSGSKTIIPAQAHAKISMRLVAGQDPTAVRDAFRAFVRASLPCDCRVTFHADAPGTPGILLDADLPLVDTARSALAAEWGKPTALIATGGSIPAASELARLGLPVLMVGFSLMDDGQHSPNEKYDVESFHRGTRSWGQVACCLGATGAGHPVCVRPCLRAMVSRRQLAASLRVHTARSDQFHRVPCRIAG